jgi:AAA+ ATPase superfamily predicted ATPase
MINAQVDNKFLMTFVGRERELEKLINTLEVSSVILTGSRRIGKTTLLRALMTRRTEGVRATRYTERIALRR